MKKKLLGLLAALTLAAVGYGDDDGLRVKVDLASDYDLDSAALIYLTTTGNQGAVVGGPVLRGVSVSTVATTTDLIAATAGTAPFQGLAAGDEIWINVNGVPVGRKIVTFTDADTLVVDTAYTITGTYTSFGFRKFVAGTTATSGWIPMSGLRQAAFSWQLKQSDAASIDVQVECKVDGVLSASAPVFAKNYATYGCATATAGCESVVLDPSVWDFCRLGFKINVDASDVGANLEQVSAQFVGYRVR